ncbi:MAG: flippase-like domain-containing protein [Bacteroidetes bacterium]|jgi:uncharacterized membrane protein YbhN (UPF0104 family)|nr:flippase-like domain-containing protein [Bacteroidota bacterium]
MERIDLRAMSDRITFWSRWKGTLIKWALSLLVLAAVFMSISWRDLLGAWQSVSWTAVGAALLLLPFQIGFRMLRWQHLLRHAGSDASMVRVAKTIMAGYAFAVVTPAEVGDVAYRMHRHYELSSERVAGVVVLEKLTHSLLALVPGVPALVLMVTHHAWWSVLSLVVMISIVVGLAFGHHRFARLQLAGRWQRLRRVDTALQAFSAIPRRGLLQAMGWTACILLVYVVQEYVLLNAVASLGIVETWNGFWAGIGLRTLAPVFIMDLGIREASHIAFFGYYGIGAAPALAVSLLMFAVNVLLPTMCGLAVFLADRRVQR